MFVCILNSIGVFDSGYGGLSVFKHLIHDLPNHNFIYLGDNARSPYGNRSFDTVYEYTLQAVNKLFNLGCPLVILACNTASAKALRNIQQINLPQINPNNRVLGVIRPTAEIIGHFSKSKNIGILGTSGTISSGSYDIEIKSFYPDIHITSLACPMWVPLVENFEINNPGTHYFVKRDLDTLFNLNPKIDTILLACTHYPLLYDIIQSYLPSHIKLIMQGPIVSSSLKTYLNNHPEIDTILNKNSVIQYYTTDDSIMFDTKANFFLGRTIESQHIEL